MAKVSSGTTPCVHPASCWLAADLGCDAEETSHSMVREQLARILQSPVFIQSTRLSRFLSFVVESTLSDESNCLKEYVIGTEVYDRKPPYHPSQDSIVRTEARRLRSKLKEYYESEGKADPMFIYFRIGSYAPVFRLNKHIDVPSLSRGVSETGTASECVSASIAIVPYIDLSVDTLATECARGITEELSHALMKIDGCRVLTVSPGTLLVHESKEIHPLAQKLGVHFVFEGTVRKENRTLRITSRVLDNNGFQVWSQRFETESDQHNLFTITEQVASALVSRTRPQEFRSLSMNTTASATGRMALCADSMMDEGSEVDMRLALSRFEEMAIAEPSCARAHCGIAQCNCEIALSGNAGSASAVSEAKSATLRALSLDSQMAVAHSCLGSILALELKWGAAKKAFEHALRLGPDAFTYRQFALFLTARREFDEAWHCLRKSQTIDPFSCRQKLTYVKFLYFSRQFDELVQHFMGPSTYGPLPVEAQLYLGLAHLQLGQLSDARELVRSVLRSSATLPCIMARVAEVAAYCGDAALADQLADKYALRSRNSPISRFRQASLSSALGDSQGAIALLAVAHKEQEPELLWMEADPAFDSIRANKQFERVMKDVAHATDQ